MRFTVLAMAAVAVHAFAFTPSTCRPVSSPSLQSRATSSPVCAAKKKNINADKPFWLSRGQIEAKKQKPFKAAKVNVPVASGGGPSPKDLFAVALAGSPLVVVTAAVAGLFLAAPGEQTPFDFLDQFYPPAVERKAINQARAEKLAEKNRLEAKKLKDAKEAAEKEAAEKKAKEEADKKAEAAKAK